MGRRVGLNALNARNFLASASNRTVSSLAGVKHTLIHLNMNSTLSILLSDVQNAYCSIRCEHLYLHYCITTVCFQRGRVLEEGSFERKNVPCNGVGRRVKGLTKWKSHKTHRNLKQSNIIFKVQYAADNFVCKVI